MSQVWAVGSTRRTNSPTPSLEALLLAVSYELWRSRWDGGWYGGPSVRKTGTRKSPPAGSVHVAVQWCGHLHNTRGHRYVMAYSTRLVGLRRSLARPYLQAREHTAGQNPLDSLSAAVI